MDIEDLKAIREKFLQAIARNDVAEQAHLRALIEAAEEEGNGEEGGETTDSETEKPKRREVQEKKRKR